MASLEGWNFTIKLCPHAGRVILPQTCFVPRRLFNDGTPRLAFTPEVCLAGGMKQALSIFFGAVLAFSFVRADLTMVEKIEGMAGAPGQVTILIKGDKMRIDSTPQVSAILDGHTGDMITLMKDQKCAVRISAEKMKAAAAMITKFNGEPGDAAAAKPKPTGRKQTINGYAAEEYASETARFKASYWLAPKYPDGAAVLRQLQAIKPEIWKSANPNVASFNDFSALPIRTVIDMGSVKLTTEIVSVKQDPIPDSAFAIPADFQEIKAPEIEGPEETKDSASPAHP